MGKNRSGSLVRQAACDSQLAEAGRAVGGMDIINLCFAGRCGLALSGGGKPPDADWAVRGNRTAVGQEFAGVVEEDDAVAQQAPPLLRVEGDGAGRVTIRAVSRGARGPV